MSMGWFVNLVAGVFGLVAVVAMFLGVVSEKARRRGRLFRIGCFAMTTAGLALAFGSFVGWVGDNEFFGGLLMILFGSSATLAPPQNTRDESHR